MAGNNPQKIKVILFKDKNKTVQSGKEYLVITDREGVEHKISEKRSNLWELFDNASINEAFVLIYESYNKIDYIADVQTIKEAARPILERAIKESALKMGDQQTEERNRSQAIAYSKDIVCSGKLSIDDMFTKASDIYGFIKTGNTPDDKGE